MPADARIVVVLAAVIERDGLFHVTRRLKDTHLAGYWEFPGGKCEPDETHQHGLAREIREELGADSTVGDGILTTEHSYPEKPEKIIRLHFYRCELATEARPMLGQEMRWVNRSELRTLTFPEADRDLIDLLTIPPTR
jgi:8-oxo-dGTP diphosphatase